MIELIHRLRTRPVHVRRRIAMMTSGVITAFIALVWITASVALSGGNGAVAEDTNATSTMNSALVGGAAASLQYVHPPTATLTAEPSQTPAPVTMDQSSQTVLPF